MFDNNSFTIFVKNGTVGLVVAVLASRPSYSCDDNPNAMAFLDDNRELAIVVADGIMVMTYIDGYIVSVADHQP